MGVRSPDKAQAYLDTAMAYGLLPKGAERRVQIVEYDVTQPDTIAAAIGSAAKVHALPRASSMQAAQTAPRTACRAAAAEAADACVRSASVKLA